MSAYLLEREKQELLKSETRQLDFPDGKTITICMNNVIWRWYDRIEADEFGSGMDNILAHCLKHSKDEENIRDGWTLDRIIAWRIEADVMFLDHHGIDITETETDLKIMMAKKATMKFHARNSKPPAS